MTTLTGNSNTYTQQYKTPIKSPRTDQSIINMTSDTSKGQSAISQRLYEIKNSQYMVNSVQSQITKHDSLRVKLRVFNMVEKRLRQSFEKIVMFSRKYNQGRKRMIYGIGRVFRTVQHQLKYLAFQNLKKLVIWQRNQELKQTQKVFSEIYQTGCRLLGNFYKNKLRRNQQQAVFKIKMEACTNLSERKEIVSKLYRIVLKGRKKCLQEGFKCLKTGRYNYVKKIKALQIMNILKDNRLKNLRKGFTNMKRNVLNYREEQLKNDKGIVERKIMTQSQSEVLQNQEKVNSLELQLQEIAKQKQQMNRAFLQQKQFIEEKSQTLRYEIEKVNTQNQRIITRTQKIDQQIHEPYTMNEIGSFLYNNLLVFLHQNPNAPLSKKDIIKAIETPLLPINVDISLIKQENEVMKSLLSEYIVIFGAKNLKMQGIEIEKPYEYLQKENNILHNILLTLIGRLNMTKDDIGHIRDGIQNMGVTVKQLDKFQNNLKEKKILLRNHI